LQPASACLPCRARHRQVMPVQQRRGIQCRGYKHAALSSCLCVLVAMIADAARRAGPARPTSANCAFSELLRVPPSARIHRSALMVWPRRSPWMLPEWERPPRRDVCGHGARRGCCQSGSGLRAAMFVATALAVDAANAILNHGLHGLQPYAACPAAARPTAALCILAPAPWSAVPPCGDLRVRLARRRTRRAAASTLEDAGRDGGRMFAPSR
jgi:hypothetical protein